MSVLVLVVFLKLFVVCFDIHSCGRCCCCAQSTRSRQTRRAIAEYHSIRGIACVISFNL